MVFKGQRAFAVTEKLYYYFPVTFDGSQGFACLEGKMQLFGFSQAGSYVYVYLLWQFKTLLVYYNFTV